MYEIEPNKEVKIIALEIAVPAGIDCGEQLSAIFSGYGLPGEDCTIILDWKYTGKEWLTRASNTPEEGDIFDQPRTEV